MHGHIKVEKPYIPRYMVIIELGEGIACIIYDVRRHVESANVAFHDSTSPSHSKL